MKKIIQKKYLSLYFPIIIALFQISCGNITTKESEEHEHEEKLAVDIVELRADQIKLAKIETGRAEMREMYHEVKVTGVVSVAPQNMATVCMPMGGFVKSTSLMPGNIVKKGQTLAIIENSDFIDLQQSYLEAKNKLSYAEAEFNRHQMLFKEDVYSQKNLQQVNIEYKNLKSLVSALKQKLGLIGINPQNLTEENISRSIALVSPISGYVKAVNISVGKSVTSSDVLFEIVNSNNLFLELSLFEKDINKIANGQKIRFYINNETEQHEAVIYQTGKSINSDKTFKVYAKVIGNCQNLIPGIFVNALVKSNKMDVMALPADAVVNFDDKDYIFIFVKQKKENQNLMTEYQMIEVTKGATDGNYVEITPLTDIDISTAKVVIKGAYNLLSAKKNAGEMSC